MGPVDPRPLVQNLLQTTLPQFERDLQSYQKWLQAAPPPSPTGTLPPADPAIFAGEEKYTDIRVPVLAFFAVPQDLPPAVFENDPAARATLEAINLANSETQIKAFENGVPSARVVRLAHANHYVFLSNEADVLREMNAFLASLP
jgi:non-heme chloroperoxidase